MKYQHLLIVILITTTATWIWAEPSKEVVVQSSIARVASTNSDEERSDKDWTYDISSPEKVERQPNPEPQRLFGFTRQDMGLDLSITPGHDLKSTTFEVLVKVPEENRASYYNFKLVLKEFPDQFFVTQNVESLGNDRFRFTGADLVKRNGYFKPSPNTSSQLPDITGFTSCVVSTSLRDPHQSRYSRGSRRLTIKSEPVRLSLR